MQNAKVEDNLHDNSLELEVANERKQTDKRRLFLKTTKSQHSMDDTNKKVSEIGYNKI